MSTIGGRAITFEEFGGFLATYMAYPKPIFFWDTCALLEIIRFIYRKNNDQNTLNAILDLAGKASRDEIYCVTSELAAIEWDDNEASVLKTMRTELEETEMHHSLAATTINTILSGSVQSDPISVFRLEDVLKDIALNIAQSSHFIKYDEVTKDTLTRVALKIPPAKEKDAEIKDCAFWETMLRLCKDINAAMPGGSPAKVFYTVNTKDFADKSRGKDMLFLQLQNEVNLMKFECAFKIDDAVNAL